MNRREFIARGTALAASSVVTGELLSQPGRASV